MMVSEVARGVGRRDDPRRADRNRRERRRTLALFLACLGFYLLTASGHFYAADEESLYRVTESLIERGTFAVPDTWGIVGSYRDDAGARYVQYTPGQSLAALPLYLLGKVFAPFFPAGQAGFITRFAVSLFNPFVTAATVALLYRLARLLRFGGHASLALALIYAVASGAWPHSRTFFSEPLTALLLLVSFTLIEASVAVGKPDAAAGDGDPPWRSLRLPLLLLSGAAALAAMVVKPQGAIALPILGLFLLARVWSSGAGDWQARLWRVVGAAAIWAIGLALVALPFALYNRAIYGGPFSTGYGDGAPDVFRTDFLTGLYGLTVSSGKGIVWYTPPILLGIAGWWGFFRRQPAAALACLGILLVHLGFYSRVDYWHGDGSWGPRYLIIALPFLLLPAVALLEGLAARPIRRAIVGTIVVLGIAVQLLGVLVNFDWYLLRSDEKARHFTPAASPILAHARIVAGRATEWRYRIAPPPGSAFIVRGFSYSESMEGLGETGASEAGASLFPRWTDGAGMVRVYPRGTAPLTVKLTFFDHRPRAARTELATVLVDGLPLPAGTLDRRDVTGNGEGWIYQFQAAPAPDGRTPLELTLRSATWNPESRGVTERNEELGVFVHNIEIWQEGRPLDLRQGLEIAPLPDTPRWRFWWTNDDALHHHLTDNWAWYLAFSGLGQPQITIWIGGYAAIAAALILAGVRLGWRTLPVRAPRVARRAARSRRRVRRTRPASAAGGAPDGGGPVGDGVADEPRVAYPDTARAQRGVAPAHEEPSANK